MNIQEKAGEGYEWRLTDKGKAIGRIAIKYDDSYPNKQYRNSCPVSWVNEGYVERVEVSNGKTESKD